MEHPSGPGVLFVCLGNICRSPTAEGVMRKLIADSGLEGEVRVDSAGTIGYHAGGAADARMSGAASRRGYRLDSISRQIAREDFDNFDLIVAMDGENYNDIRSLAPGAPGQVRLFSEFLPPGSPREVPDPYYGGPRGFDVVLDLIEQGCPAILEELVDRRS